MTQVQTMTNPELNQALAVLMGWKAGGDPNKKRDFVWWIDENRFRLPENWDPCTDPAASLEVQAKAIEVNYELYVDQLSIVVYGEENYNRASNWNEWDISRLLIASPRERAEAAYITLSQVTT
ncbi:hypothetical protein [Paenibacillus jilunlii]|uniref:Phage ABA sandwich domain-containing protein n=1 Tax=Paenibacillus jilunlii TaxID=682956 RepID=A0A1H0A0C9_9BACL|nr:hypothetical protein [Paenibacillus jilunlii]KWX79939.1 hypothetical protein AML91_01860 [Paenibacillus jilunlii]SDN27272.1 hypothetical protein SAMN05216191_13429 [Paenibacillus jilunlii]